MEEDSTTDSGSLFHRLTILTLKKFCRTCSRHIWTFNFSRCPRRPYPLPFSNSKKIICTLIVKTIQYMKNLNQVSSNYSLLRRRGIQPSQSFCIRLVLKSFNKFTVNARDQTSHWKKYIALPATLPSGLNYDWVTDIWYTIWHHGELIKAAFHDTDTDILARILPTRPTRLHHRKDVGVDVDVGVVECGFNGAKNRLRGSLVYRAKRRESTEVNEKSKQYNYVWDIKSGQCESFTLWSWSWEKSVG